MHDEHARPGAHGAGAACHTDIGHSKCLGHNLSRARGWACILAALCCCGGGACALGAHLALGLHFDVHRVGVGLRPGARAACKATP